MNLRPYTPSDLNAMVALDDICFEAPFRFSRASMRSFAQAKNACTVVAESEGTLAGFCILHVERSRRRDLGYIVTLDVAPIHRRKGLARKLMQAAEQMAIADGCTSLVLHVHIANEPALHFYNSLGFAYTDTIPAFYGEGLDALLLHRALPEFAD
jgi:ribosomal-protein-alanine N-acetyltransferase